ncbi:Protein-tyrosine-phosphatase MKP1 [Zea mays]|uniref:Protein-tyrosine-phosphatase MKP1 n=1 Tax=Zea mays TaxID=4577 RepID=A0A3L6D634_MAIZE|nr:Protein-tyrosine-phosphatase MKP1 [Zea mays]
MSSKARSCLPPLQPLAITRRSLDEWPKAGSDVGEWPNPTTPGASRAGGGGGGPSPAKPGEGLRLDLSSLRSQGQGPDRLLRQGVLQVLRMYRMAPHSQYAPLHLVPKMLNDPSPATLDSRGAFIVHVLSSLYVWVGMKCDPVMEKDAKAAAFQVVRYEKVQGHIKVVREGLEPQEFWDAFSSMPPNSDSNTKISKDQIDSASKSDPGSRKIESYDADFELVYKAITGGVVPAFSTSGAGDETHLPARESSWSLLRHKFLQWPSMGKLTTFARKDLDPKSVLIFVTSNAIRRGEAVKMVYVWVGGENESSKSVDSVDWQQVTSDFLHLKGLSNVLPVKVFKEHEAENLLELLNVSYIRQ